MANQVANRSAGAVAALTSLRAGIANVKQTLVKKGGDPYLRMLKDGTWVYGQEDTEIEEGSRWAINPLSIHHGWTAWRRGDNVDNSGGPVAEVMVPASVPMPAQSALPDISHVKEAQWAQQFSFSLVCLTGNDRGEQTLFKTNSVGGIAAVDKILGAIATRLDENPDNPVPIVVLDSDSYKHRRYGTTYAPVIDIKDWAPLSDSMPDIGDDTDEQPDETPAPTARKRSAPVKAEPAPADDGGDDDEIAAMEAAIAAKKAAKEASGKPEEDPAAAEKARRKADLAAQLAALDDGVVEDVPTTPAPAGGQPMRRRRSA